MKLLVLTDTHGDIGLINRWVRAVRSRFGVECAAVLHCGDVGMYPRRNGVPFGVGLDPFVLPVYAVHGNHEDRRTAQMIARRELIVPSFFLFSTESPVVVVRDVVNDGSFVTVMGVGGAYNAPHSSTAGTLPFDESVPARALDAWRAAGSPPIDVLIAHEAPDGLGAIGDPRYGNPSRCGSPGMRTLWETVAPRWWLSGHYHKWHRAGGGGRLLTILPEARAGAAILDSADWSLTTLGGHTLAAGLAAEVGA